jgi:hypothetical protein
VESGITSLWIVDLSERTSKRVGISAGQSGLTWWPDGRRLILGGRGGMTWMDVERPDVVRPLSPSATVQVPWSLAPGGRRLAYYAFSPTTGFDVWTVPVVGADSAITLGAPEAFVRTRAFEAYPAFSPDGRWIAYSSNETGRYEIYVRPFPDSGPAVRVSTQSGRMAAWSRTRHELLFQTDGQRLMVTGYHVDGGKFVAGAPREWTPLPLGDAGVLPSFDVTQDADRVVALLPAGRPEDAQSKNHVTVVMNFQEEVRRRLAPRTP